MYVSLWVTNWPRFQEKLYYEINSGQILVLELKVIIIKQLCGKTKKLYILHTLLIKQLSLVQS